MATAPTCWGMAAAASLVVIMGTQYFDGSGATGGQDYPVTDLLQMMGRASRPDKDESGRYVSSRLKILPCWNVLPSPELISRESLLDRPWVLLAQGAACVTIVRSLRGQIDCKANAWQQGWSIVAYAA